MQSFISNFKVSLADSKLPIKCETYKHLRLPPTPLAKLSSISFKLQIL